MPYERKIRHASKPALLADLEVGDAVEVTCTICRHWSLLAPHVLLARFPASVSLAAVLEKVQCSACGGKESTWALVRARPPRDARRY